MRLSTLLLLVCCGTLAAVICYEFIYYDPLSEAAPSLSADDASHTDESEKDPEYDYPLITQFREISERPLFSPSRSRSNTHRESVDAYRLRGIFSSKNRKFGLVERLSDGTSIRVSDGGIIDGWQVLFIDEESIVMTDSSQVVTLEITHARDEEYIPEVLDEEILYEGELAEGNTDSDLGEALYAENGEEEEAYMPWGMDRRSGQADHLRPRSNQRAYAADRRTVNYTPVIPSELLLLPPPPPPIL